MGKKNITFDDIAKYTHFSKATISRYFNDPDYLSAKNREIIRQALIDLDYTENKVARILAKGSTEFIGVILPSLNLPFFSEVLSSLLSTYEEFGYKFIVFVGSENADIERRYVQELIAYQIEGLIVMNHVLSSRELSQLPVPVVSIEREDTCISSVNTDNYAGARSAAALLEEHACDIYIHVNTDTSDDIPAYQRKCGFEDYCQSHGLPYEIHLINAGYDYAQIDMLMLKLFEEIEQTHPKVRKGIFLSDDTRANSFVNHMLRKYHELSAEYRIIGFDDSMISREAVHPLSTVSQQVDKIARETVRLLRTQIQGHHENSSRSLSSDPVHIVVPPLLCRRDTTEYYSNPETDRN